MRFLASFMDGAMFHSRINELFCVLPISAGIRGGRKRLTRLLNWYYQIDDKQAAAGRAPYHVSGAGEEVRIRQAAPGRKHGPARAPANLPGKNAHKGGTLCARQ
jgi:hypothetical protein